MVLTVPSAPEFFDAQSDAFDDEYRTNPNFGERLAVWRELVAKYGRAGATAVDVGCGSGAITACAIEHGMRAIGIDPAQRMLDLAARRVPAATLIRGALDDVFGGPGEPAGGGDGPGGPAREPLRGELVLCSSVLEYVPDLDRALGQLARATEAGGHVIVSLPNAAGLYRRAEALWFRATGRPTYRALVAHVMTPAALAARAARHGLVAVETRYYATHHPLRAVERVLPLHRRAAMFATVFARPRPRVLCLVQLPPPVHGPARVNEQVLASAHLAARFELDVLPIRSTASLAELEQVSVEKIQRSLATGVELAAALAARRPAAVYFTLSPAGPAFYRDCVYVAVLKAFGVRRIYHLHGRGVAEAVARPGHAALYRWVFDDADVICLAPAMRADLAGLVAPARIHDVANGVADEAAPELAPDDVAEAVAGSPAAAPAGDRGPAVPRILFLSNLARTKGPLVLAEALGLLAARGVAFEATFAGAPGNDGCVEALEARIAELGLAGCVRYVGPVYGAAKLALYRAHDVLAFPTTRDAFPLVVLEAMQQARAIVASDEGCIAEILGDAGVVVPPSDPGTLAAALAAVLADGARRRDLGARARARYLAEFTLARFERALGDAWAACLEPR